MHGRLLALLTSLVVLSCAGSGRVQAQSFYEGKTLRIIVGLAAGGGFDAYARVIARHMGKHIPGSPTIIVENMTGAGSLISANHLYRVAKPDGLTVAHFLGSLIFGQVLGQPGIEFDARKFEFIGAALKEDAVCALAQASSVTSIEKWMASKTPVKLGGTGLGSPPDNVARIVKAALGLPIQVVSGYKGTSAIRLAAESGEVAGGCWGWESIKATWRKGIETGEVAIVLQTQPQPAPDMPNVPLAMSFARTEEARQLIKIGIQDAGAITRPFVLPPGTAKDRVQLFRKAFLDTLRDPEFKAEAEKVKLDIDPMPGEELERIVHGLFKLDAAFVAKLKKILK